MSEIVLCFESGSTPTERVEDEANSRPTGPQSGRTYHLSPNDNLALTLLASESFLLPSFRIITTLLLNKGAELVLDPIDQPQSPCARVRLRPVPRSPTDRLDTDPSTITPTPISGDNSPSH